MPTHNRIRVFASIFVVLMMIVIGALQAAENSMYTVRIPLKGKALLESLAERNIEILSIDRHALLSLYVDARQLDYLRSLGLPVSVIETPDMDRGIAALDQYLGQYHTYAEMETVLTDLAATYPSIAELSVLGNTIEGRNIYMLKISDNVIVDEGEPEALFMSNLHSREIMTVEITLKLAIYLLENYGIDPTVTTMVDEREIFIVPMCNPDGHVYVENNHTGSSGGWWRKNRRLNPLGSYGVDLNRNFGYLWGYDDVGSSPVETDWTYRGTGPFSEPETQAIRTLCNSRNFSMMFSYHSSGELLLYPWGYDYLYTPDHDVYKALGDTLTSSNGYFPGNPAMGAIYLVNGDSDDWMYGEDVEKNSIFGFTPETNTQFDPPEADIQPTFDLLLPMNMLLLELADNPRRIVAPWTPTMYAVDTTPAPQYVLSWSATDPSDPNPVIDYDVIEYNNYHTIAQDPADGPTSLWVLDGFSQSNARPYTGNGSYYSGAVNNNSSTLEAATFYRVTNDTKTFTSWLWYNIETNWDYAYVEVSTDGGLTWVTVPGNITTNSNPNGNNRGNGITGPSPGWVQGIFPLDAYLGQDIALRWNYVTDAWVLEEGIYVDLPGPVPTYDSKSVIGPVAATSLLVTPSETGDFTYAVRARDAEGQSSPQSNSVDHTVTTVTGIGDPMALPSWLGANYPNPFNPVTQMPYRVAATPDGPVPVALGIYNVAGERVALVVNGEMPTGAYEATWTGRTDNGVEVPSGVYFAKLQVSGETVQIRKLVLLK